MNGIERIKAAFNANKICSAYITAGDGGIKHSLTMSLALLAGGVNSLEIGVPFSDPVADGPVIQRAAERALTAGTTLADVLWLISEIRKQHANVPLVLFSYFNPILSALQSSFLAEAKQAGVDGLLIVDCPIEEAPVLQQACLAQDIAPIYIITPATSIARMRKIERYGRGFLYYACRKGTTGVRNVLPADFVEKIREIKSNIHLPIMVGFGVAERTIAEQVLHYADGVVVGSRFVKAIEEGAQAAELTALAHSIYGRE